MPNYNINFIFKYIINIMIIKHISIVILFNIIAIFIYFFKICVTYGCFYNSKNGRKFILPYQGITLPILTLFKDFNMGVKMMMSFNNAWIYIFIATISSLSIIFIRTRFNKENEKNAKNEGTKK